MLGPAAGPLLGGFITTYLHWRLIFFINVPIGILGIYLTRIPLRSGSGDCLEPGVALHRSAVEVVDRPSAAQVGLVPGRERRAGVLGTSGRIVGSCGCAEAAPRRRSPRRPRPRARRGRACVAWVFSENAWNGMRGIVRLSRPPPLRMLSPACIRSNASLMSLQRQGVGDHRVDLDLPVHVPVDDLGRVGAAPAPPKAEPRQTRPVTSWNGRVAISLPASATPMMMLSPQPRWQAFQRLAHHRRCCPCSRSV